MARTVANLAVSITARTRGLRRGLKRARGEVGAFTAALKKISTKIAQVGAIGAGIVTAGVGAQIKSLDKLAKTADKLGIKPTALIALRDAAQESGVEVKTFDMALQRMLRRIQEASVGKGEALQTLKDLKLDAKALVKLAPEDQVMAVAKAMDRGKAAGLDLSRAMKLMDSEGVAAVNTLRLLNDKGLKPFITEVKKSGRAVTRDQLKPIENVKDSLLRLGKNIQGVFTRLALAISKPLARVLEVLERLVKSPEVVNALRDAFKGFGDSVENAGAGLIDFIKNWDKTEKAIKDGATNIAGDAAKILKAVGITAGGGAAAIEQGVENLMQGSNVRSRLMGGGDPSKTINRLRGQPELFDAAIDDASAVLGDLPDRIKRVWGNFIDGPATAAFESVPRVVAKAIVDSNKVVSDAAANAPGANRVFQLNGRNIPPGPRGGGAMSSSAVVDELKRQTAVLQNLDQGTDPRGLPAGTMVIRVNVGG